MTASPPGQRPDGAEKVVIPSCAKLFDNSGVWTHVTKVAWSWQKKKLGDSKNHPRTWTLTDAVTSGD